MKKYITFLKLRFSMGLQYRIAAYAGVSTQFAWGFMTILMFSAFYRSNPDAFPMSMQQTASYIWLQQAFLTALSAWSLEGELFSVISSGNVAYEMCRPLDIYDMWFTRQIAMRLSRVALRCAPVLIVSFLLPSPYGLRLPPDLMSGLLFVPTLVMSMMVVIAYTMIVYGVTFYTLSPQGVRLIGIAATELFAGAIIPLPFLPDNVRRVFELLPFGSMQNLPMRIYGGNIAGGDAWFFIVVQMFWLVALVLLGRWLFGRALKRVVVQGG